MKPFFDLCEKAKITLSEIIAPTPLVKNDYLSKKYSANVYLKLENLQPVGSFKLRGATFKIANLTNEEKEKGVLAVSAGNHAQGVAWAASRFNTQATIIMPKASPMIKVANTERLGAKVVLFGENVDEGFEYAKDVVSETGKVFVHPFHDPYIIAGQSTVAYELLNQLEKIDFVFGGIGGGGLMSGVSTVLKHFGKTHVIGAQASGANSMVRSLQSGTLQKSNSATTFADGIRVKNPNPEMFELLDGLIDEAIEVTDEKIAQSVLVLMEHARVIAEGAGAIGLASLDELYQRNPRSFKGKNIVLLVSGGNIDINLVDRIIDKGLLESSRRVKYSILLDDRPGMLNHLTGLIGSMGANILQVVHDREVPHLELQKSAVIVTIETKGEEHAKEIENALHENFFKVVPKL